MKDEEQRRLEKFDWHIDPDALTRYYALSGVQSLSETEGLRVRPTFGDAEGFREIINLADGFQVIIGDITCHKEAYLSMRSDPALKFHFRLEGTSEFGITDKEESRISQHTVGVLLRPEGLDKQEHYLAGEHERSITLICESNYLRSHYRTLTNCLPTPLSRYIEHGESTAYSEHFSMRTDMVTAASAIFNTGLEGALRRGLILAKSTELLILSLQSIIDAEANIDNPEKGLSRRDIERIHLARTILETNFIHPPTIGELARHIGVNEAKLMHGFKQLFGQTIFDCTQNLRMEQAKELLENTDRSITEIAYDVGYEYSSNFTTAFKRRFGITPSAARDAYRQ